jgi:hypothetical protein
MPFSSNIRSNHALYFDSSSFENKPRQSKYSRILFHSNDFPVITNSLHIILDDIGSYTNRRNTNNKPIPGNFP